MISEIKLIVEANMIFDTGFAKQNGIRYNETTSMFSVIYDGVLIPYIWWQEKSFKHWISKKVVNKNKGFIENDTVNAIDHYVNIASTTERSILSATNKEIVQQRNSQISQGILRTYKGNEVGNSVLVGQ